MNIDIANTLSVPIFATLVVFARIGSALMLFPGIGETFVPMHSRLMLAITMSIALVGTLAPQLPAEPDSVSSLFMTIAHEVVIGVFLGAMLRIMADSIATAGSIIALQTGLSNATVLNPTQATANLLPSAFFSVTGLALIFVTGLDHLMIRAVVATYNVLPAKDMHIITGDMANSFSSLISRSFAAGVGFAAPFVIIGILFNIALGVMQKLMPMLPLFLVAMPAQIAGSLVLLSLTATALCAAWLKYINSELGTFITSRAL